MQRTTESLMLQTPLTDLKGIGPAKASRIQQALQIEFAEELVGLDVEAIFQKLTENGPQIPRREIQQWLIQALRLVKAHEAEASWAGAGPGPEDLVSPEADDVAPTPAAEIEGNSPAGTFQISLVGDQLCAKNLLEGNTVADLTTDDPQELYQWIQIQLSPNHPEDATAAAHALPPWRIDITKVEIVPLSPTGSLQPSHSQSYLARDMPFVIGVNFQISGQTDDLYPSPDKAIAQFSIRNRLTGETIPLGTAQGPIHRLDAARLQSPPAALTNPGIYQLQTVIQLQGQKAVSGYRELQLIKVL